MNHHNSALGTYAVICGYNEYIASNLWYGNLFIIHINEYSYTMEIVPEETMEFNKVGSKAILRST